MKKQLKFVLDEFAGRQFDKVKAGLSFINFDKTQFAAKVQEAYDSDDTVQLVDGYAPFCKHIFIQNFTDAIPSFIKITNENAQYLKSGYVARTEKELAVLDRWFDLAAMPEGTVQQANILNIILYSKDQIQKENEAMGSVSANAEVDYDFGIISIKAQDVIRQFPMQPITAMRNCLGKEYGGSGVPLDVEKYNESVAFWQEHATLK